MNNLSWLLYLADLSGSVSAVFTGLSTVGVVTAVACSITWAVTGDAPTIYSFEDREAKIKAHHAYRATIASFIRPALYCFAGFALTASVIPSRETIYAIAASEMGEEVVKSETAGKAMKALNAWLDRQIAPEASQ